MCSTRSSYWFDIRSDEDREKVVCECGSVIQRWYKPTHQKTDKHIFKMARQFLGLDDRRSENEKFQCECGSYIKKGSKAKHQRTKKHLAFINKEEDTSDDEEVEVLDVFYKGNRYFVDEKTNELYNKDCEIVGKAYKTDVAKQWVVNLSSEEDTSDEDTPEPMPEFLRKWILEQFKAIEEGELDEEKTKEFHEFVDENLNLLMKTCLKNI